MKTEWQPIETFFEQHTPHSLGGEAVHYDADVIVCGVEWQGVDSPYNPAGGRWGSRVIVCIASTYLGAPCWTAVNPAPSDFDAYIRPTHWMPLPIPPLDATRPEA